MISHDVIYCNAIGQSANNMTSQEIEREKRVANAAEICKLYSHTPKFQCVKIYIREQKTVFHLAKLLIFPLTTKLEKTCLINLN